MVELLFTAQLSMETFFLFYVLSTVLLVTFLAALPQESRENLGLEDRGEKHGEEQPEEPAVAGKGGA